MNKYKIQNIIHSPGYNAGGMMGIYLVNIDSFYGYEFRDGSHFDSCYVQSLGTNVPYIEVDRVDQSNFTESYDNGIYKQKLTSFIGTLEGGKLANLLKASTKKYVVVFKTSQNKGYTFGSDGGARLSFSQQSGQIGESTGYSITFEKNSIYPLFEMEVGKIDEQELMRFFDDTFDNKFN